MKHIFLTLIVACALAVQLNAQTPFDSFAPEATRPMLEIEESANTTSDSILYAIVADMQSQMLLLVDISTTKIVATTPITDDIRKWLSVDPLADKYPGISPYAYCNWNPIGRIDFHGDSVSFAQVECYDKVLKTNVTNQTINDLQSITGLTLSLNNGMLEYSKNEDGSPVISSNGGSATARTHLISLIENAQTIGVFSQIGNGSFALGNSIVLDRTQINMFINGSDGVDNRTLGYGMTFLHESFHTDVGGGLMDNINTQGPVVERMNIIRQELGPYWGQRMSYMAFPSHGQFYIPFNGDALWALGTGLIPSSIFGQQSIRLKK